jgi:hypothetical protein
MTADEVHPQGARNLCAAILWRAALDARGGDIGSLLWIHGPEARGWADALGWAWPPDLAGVSRRRD